MYKTGNLSFYVGIRWIYLKRGSMSKLRELFAELKIFAHKCYAENTWTKQIILLETIKNN